MAKKKSASQLRAELNGWGRVYNAAKRRGDKKVMAEAHAKANAIRAQAGWDYDAKTGQTTVKTANGKALRVNSQSNVENAKIKSAKQREISAQSKNAVEHAVNKIKLSKAEASKAMAKGLASGLGPVNPLSDKLTTHKKTSTHDSGVGGDKMRLMQQKFLQEQAKKPQVSTNLVLESRKGPVNLSGMTQQRAEQEAQMARAAYLNQMVLNRASAQGTLPQTSLLAKDRKGPFSENLLQDIHKGIYDGPLQMRKMIASDREYRKYIGQMEQNLSPAEQALRAAWYGTIGSVGAALETAKTSLGNQLKFVSEQGSDYLTHRLRDLGKAYQTKYGSATIDMDGPAARAMQQSQRMRALATDDMGAVGRFLTDTGISVAQNTPGILLSLAGPLGAAAGSTYMGVNAAGGKMYDVQANGGTADEAFTRGIVSGAIEGITEKFSIDGFLKSVGNADSAKKVLQNTLRQMGVEASEESASYTLNYLADKAAKDPNATFSLTELAQNAGMGAVSGAVFGGVGGSASRFIEKNGYKPTHQMVQQNAVREQNRINMQNQSIPIDGVLAPETAYIPVPELLSAVTKPMNDVYTPIRDTQTKAQPSIEQTLQRVMGVSTEQPSMSAPDTHENDTAQIISHNPVNRSSVQEDLDFLDFETMDFVREYLKNPTDKTSVHTISKVNERQKADIARLLGDGDYTDYRNAINGAGVENVVGKPNSDTVQSGQYALSWVKSVLNDYDHVTVTDGQKPRLHFSQQVNGTEYTVELVPDRKNKTFWVVSADTNQKSLLQKFASHPSGAYQMLADFMEQGKIKQSVETPQMFEIGQKVRALDWGNLGSVVAYHPESGMYEVNFRNSETGSNQTVSMRGDMLEGVVDKDSISIMKKNELQDMAQNQIDALLGGGYEKPPAMQARQWAERIAGQHAEQIPRATHSATLSEGDQMIFNELNVNSIVERSNQFEVDRLTLRRLRKILQLTQADIIDAQEIAAGRNPIHDNLTGDKLDAVEQYADVLRQYNQNMADVRNQQREIRMIREDFAQELIAASDQWNDTKHAAALNIRTPERVFRRVMGDTPQTQRLIDNFITPVHRHEAESIRWQNEQRAKLRALTKNSTHEESVYAHMLNRLQENPENSALQKQLGDYLDAHKGKIDRERVRRMLDGMIEMTRSFYTDINEAGLRNGEQPLEFRQNYIPSLPVQQQGKWYNRLLRGMGIETMADELPTSIAGKTEEFRPVRKWQSFRQERRGIGTEFDAVKAMDTYITNAAHAIYHTDDIHNLRILEEAIRYKHSTEGGQAELDAIRNHPEWNVEQRTAKKQEVWERSTTAFPSFPTWLAQYTNYLAGKKSAADRTTEHDLGRGFYRTVSDLETKIASNMVGFNISTAITNFIPLAQGKGELRSASMMRAIKEYLGDKFAGRTDYRDTSTFLTNRAGSEKVVKTGSQKLMDASGALMGVVDEFTSNVLHRARALDNMDRRGMSESEAIAEADNWTAGLMGDRSLGAMPNFFNRKNPITKAFSMFQLEVANQYGYLFEDLPHNAKAQGKTRAQAVAYVASAMTQILVASVLYNDLAEEVTGRRPALDLVGMVNDFVGQLTGYSIPSSFDLLRAAMEDGIQTDDFRTQTVAFDQAVQNAALNVANQIPGVSMLAEGGRVPVTAAIPDAATILQAGPAALRWLINQNDTRDKLSGQDKKAFLDAGAELSKVLTYLIMPTGGGQLKKH